MSREFAVEIEWVPFELHPETPPQGLDKDPALGGADVRDRLYAMAAAEGLPMQSNPYQANGHKALEAAEWAREQSIETFDRVHRAIFQAYFAGGANVSTIDQVDAAVAETGVDRAALRAALAAGTYRERVDEYTQLARGNGINGTPTFILDDKFVISGAQDWPVFENILTRLGVPRRDTADPAPGGGPDG